MPDPTPGQVAHDAFVAARPYGASPPAVHPRWADLTPAQQRAWEAAAQAVLARQGEGIDGTGFAPPGTYRHQEDTPHA